jgi:hypothetical protein
MRILFSLERYPFLIFKCILAHVQCIILEVLDNCSCHLIMLIFELVSLRKHLCYRKSLSHLKILKLTIRSLKLNLHFLFLLKKITGKGFPHNT